MRFQFYLDSDSLGQLLIIDPIGWEDITLSLLRDKYHGVVEAFPDKFGYHSNGYTYLKELYDADGIAAECTLTVMFACSETADFELLYTGFFIFSKYVLKESECIIEIPTEPSNCRAKFLNRLEEKVGTSSGTIISLPTKTIIKTLKIEDNLSEEQEPREHFQDISDIGSQYIQMKSAVNIYGGSIYQDEPLEINSGYQVLEIGDCFSYDASCTPSLPSLPVISSPDALFICPVDGTYTFAFDFGIDLLVKTEVDNTINDYIVVGCGDNTFNNFRTEIRFIVTRSGVQVYNVLLDSETDSTCHNKSTWVQQTREIIDETGYALLVGDEVNIYAGIVHGIIDCLAYLDKNPIVYFYQKAKIHAGSFLQISLEDTANHPAVPVKMLQIDICFNNIIDSISDSCLRLYSNYFSIEDGGFGDGNDGCGGLEYLASGLRVRQFPDAKLFLSMKQLYEGMDAIHNIGMNIEGDEVIIENVKEFYQDTVSISFDNVPDLEIRFEESMVVNNLEVGYAKWESEEFNGLDEFNTKRQYSNGISITKGNKSAISSLIASAYAAEVTKRNPFLGTSTKDFKYDNDIFIFCCKRDGGTIVVDQGNITSPVNIIDPDTIYNWAISPARNAIRWWKSVMTGIKDITSGILAFKYGDGNYIAQGGYSGTCRVEVDAILEEDEDINYSDIESPHNTPLFSGEHIIVQEMMLSKTQYDTVKANSRKLIQVRKDSSSTYYQGWIKDFKYSANKGTVNFTLLKKA